MARRLFLFVILLSVGCNGPFFYFSGGELSGTGRPAPQDWSFAGDSGLAQLETSPDDPYSVNIAYTVIDGQLYINAGDTETQWVKNMTANPLVRLRLDDVLYDARAKRVTNPSAIAVFGKAWTSQSIFRRDPTQFDEVWIYRLIPR